MSRAKGLSYLCMGVGRVLLLTTVVGQLVPCCCGGMAGLRLQLIPEPALQVHNDHELEIGKLGSGPTPKGPYSAVIPRCLRSCLRCRRCSAGPWLAHTSSY